MVPTPSWARAESIELSQLPLPGAMFDRGVGRRQDPVASAGARLIRR